MSQLVSILIPAYNAEKWIEETISSAIDQTWPKKEIIIVDDGSSDNTFEIANRFQSRKVKVVRQQHQGACVARNKALSLAQGAYIQWLDADDIIHPQKILKQMAHAVDGANSRILLTSAYGTFFYRTQKAKFKPTSLWSDLLPVDWIINKFKDYVWMNPACWLVSRRLTTLSGLWDERLHRGQDGEYICRVVSKSEKVKFISDARSYYRIGNPGSISAKAIHSKEKSESIYLSLSLCINYLLHLEDSDRTREASLHHLQSQLNALYLRNPEMMGLLSRIARDLGGELLVPRTKTKYRLVQKAFGREFAAELSVILPQIKLMALKKWDQIFLFCRPVKCSSSVLE